MREANTSQSNVPWYPALWRVAPFDAFSEDERAALLKYAELRTFAAGETIYEPGDAAAGAYILLSGEAQLSDPLMDTVGGESLPVTVVGTLISKSSLLEGFKHRHRFTAVTETRALRLSRAEFVARFEAGDTFALRLLDFVVVSGSAEVRELNDAIQSLLGAN